MAHIGVIRALEEQGIPIDYVAGTSMGAIVASLYAIGYTPDEMIAILQSDDFRSWYKGYVQEQDQTYVFRRDPTPEMAGLRFDITKKGFKPSLPSSLVSSYEMDLAVMQLFSAADAAAGHNFDSLMVPFRCVASDIIKKRAYVARSGNLGTMVRASMSYPFYFKGVKIDSTILFDGGFYNNFPWNVMAQDFHPDIIIGSKCAGNPAAPDEDDIFKQLENMLVFETNYRLPSDKGVVIETKLQNVSLLDFDKVLSLSERGYIQAMMKMDTITSLVKRRVSQAEMKAKRAAFLAKLPELKFKNVQVDGPLSDAQKGFIDRSIRADEYEGFDFNRLKKNYFRTIASGNVNTFYPTAEMDPQTGLFDAHLRATSAPQFHIGVGGNISSSSVNQLYLGLDMHLWATNMHLGYIDLNLGRYFSGAKIGWRSYLDVYPLYFCEMEFNFLRYDYYKGSQDLTFWDTRPSYMQEQDMYGRVDFGVPVIEKSNFVATLGAAFGVSNSDYFQFDDFSSLDTTDKTRFQYVAAQFLINRNTLNFKQYPSSGKQQHFSLNFIHGLEKHTPGNLSKDWVDPTSNYHNWFAARLLSEWYINLNSWFSLGTYLDIVASSKSAFSDYYSTMIQLPVFSPTPHSRTLFLPEYRANIFAGIGVMPVVRFTDNVLLHFGGYYFQPYEKILPSYDDNISYTEPLNGNGFIAYGAFVWHTPLGPLSLSANYYSEPNNDWYVQLNFGYLLFDKKGINY